MTSRTAQPRAHRRILGLLVVSAALLAGCGLPPGGEPPAGDLVVDVVSTDPHPAVPTTLSRIRADIEIEVSRENDGHVSSMSIQDIDGLPDGWTTSTGSSCIDNQNESHCTAEISLTGPDGTDPGDYPLDVELRVDNTTIHVDVTLRVPL